ncbi:hypothetical protein [Roseomonas xinghualingensis]|uniref:hypothetical protein n=1 Tax=Roseomonas xinghualingensis TaxID=2986475 RepID=UPI0021F1F34D|nr:hypothetical protein [Roseomonas sp. SXEYE001]MCV4207068.1 hypothetical protein [Roseomonas sp. SXEYE001]
MREAPVTNDRTGAWQRNGAAQDELLRHLVADAVRRVLEEGLRKAHDPLAYLRSAVEEIGHMVAVFAEARPAEGAELRAILAEQVVEVTQELMARHHH